MFENLDKILKKKQREEFNKNFSYNEENISNINEKAIDADIENLHIERTKLIARYRIKKLNNNYQSESLQNKIISKDLYNSIQSEKYDINNINFYLQEINNNNNDLLSKFKGLVALKNLCSYYENECLSPILYYSIKSLNNVLIDLLSNGAEFQLEILIILSYFFYNNYGDSLILLSNENDSIFKISNLICSNIEEVKNQAIITISNIMFNEELRNEIVKKKIFSKFLNVFELNNDLSTIKASLQFLIQFYSVSKNNFPYERNLLKLFIKKFNLITQAENIDYAYQFYLLIQFCVSHISIVKEEILNSEELINFFMKFINSNDIFIQKNTLDLINDLIVYCLNNNKFKEILDIINFGLFNELKTCLNQTNEIIVIKECLIILGNVSMLKEIAKILFSFDIMKFIKNFIEFNKNNKRLINYEIIIINNFTCCKKILNNLIENNVIEMINYFMKQNLKKSQIKLCIDSLENILRYYKKKDNKMFNNITKKIEEIGMFDLIEKLQSFPEQKFYLKILNFIETYFEIE